jgi:hypothetical protein
MGEKYTFRREFTDMYGKTRVVEHTLEAESLTDVLEDFVYFLNGCSFAYVKDLIWVKENGQEESILGYEPRTVEELDDMTKQMEEIARQLY